MCMEDIAIQRATKTNVYFWNGSDIDLPSNANRLSVKITCTLTGDVELLAISANVNGGGNVNASLAYASRRPGDFLPYELVTLESVGDILLGPLRLTSPNNTACYAIETYLDVNAPSLAKYNVSPPTSADILKKSHIGS